MTDIRRKAWRIPPDLRADVWRVLTQHETDRFENDRFSVRWAGEGQLLIGVPEVNARLLIEGRSRQESFKDVLAGTANAERETHRLVLEVEVLPGHEFECDVADLDRMAGALEQLYGHGINATVTREEPPA